MTMSQDSKIRSILERIRGVFAEKGFDGASMQDLARGAGMSAGNFYRYFASKSDLIESMVEHDLGQIEAEFDRIMTSPSPIDSLRETLSRRMLGDYVHDLSPLWAEIEAASVRRPEIGLIHQRMEAAVLERLLQVFVRISGLDLAEVRVRYSSHAAMLFMLVKGAAMQAGCPLSADPKRTKDTPKADTALAMRLADLVLSEISSPHTDFVVKKA